MSVNALTLVLCASLTHAIWNFLAKKANGDIPFIWLVYSFSAIIFLPFVIALVVNNPVTPTPFMVVICFVSGGLRLLYFIVLQTGYRKADLSLVYPLGRGSAPFFSTLAAIFVLRETPTFYSVAGLVMIVCGVFILTRPKLTITDLKIKAGVFYGMATGCLIAVYTIWDKIALSHNIIPLLLIFSSHVMGAFLLAPTALKNKVIMLHELKTHRWPIISIALLSPMSYILVLEAMKTTDVIYIAPAREVSILFSVLIGGKLLSEKQTKRRLVAACCMLAGIIILSI